MDTDELLDIDVEDENIDFTIDKAKIRSILSKIKDLLNVQSYCLSLRFVDDVCMQELNSRFRNKDRSTDVLSFPQEEFDPPLTLSNKAISRDEGIPLMLGDIVISITKAYENAEHIGQGVDREVCFLLIHGVLHLVGHDHIEDEERFIMEEQQNQLLSQLGTVNPCWKNCIVQKEQQS